MEDYRPQDDYFEWEDIIPFRPPFEVPKTPGPVYHFSLPPLSSLPKPLCENGQNHKKILSNTPLSCPTLSCSSNDSTSEVLDSPLFPSYDDMDPAFPEEVSTVGGICKMSEAPKVMRPAQDDMAVLRQPTRHVDYLSHSWKEEDIRASYQYIKCNRSTLNKSERIENACWRSWAMLRWNLRTVSPDCVCWNKDVDDILLYGPFQAGAIRTPEPSTIKNTKMKSILKKPTRSEAILRGSLSWTNLPKQVTPPSRPQNLLQLRSLSSQLTSTLTNLASKWSGATKISCAPDKRGIRFDEVVEQTISVNPLSTGWTPKSNWAVQMIKRIPPTTLKTDICYYSYPQKPTHTRSFQRLPTCNHSSHKESSNSTLSDWQLLTHAGEDEDELDYLFSAYQPCTADNISIHARANAQSDPINININNNTKSRFQFAYDIAPDEDEISMPSSPSSTDSEMESLIQDTSDISEDSSSASEYSSDDGVEELDICHVKPETRRLQVVTMDSLQKALVERVAEEFYASEDALGWDGI